MKLHSSSISDSERIDPHFAFCKTGNPVALSDNVNPHLKWTDVPEGTQSFVVIAHDETVPTDGTDVNVPGRDVPATLPRQDFTHWVLIDIPANVDEIREGEFSQGVTPRGKSGPAIDGYNMRHGLNDYTGWFANDDDMSGNYFGYDGPAPPWNDSLVHRYHFTVYALDINKVPVAGNFTRTDVLEAIKDHILAEASISGTYTLNKRLF